MGGNKFQPREFPRSGSKAIDIEEEEEEERRAKVGNNNGQLCIERHHLEWRTQAAWAKISSFGYLSAAIAVLYLTMSKLGTHFDMLSILMFFFTTEF